MKRKLLRNALLILLGVMVIFASGCTDNSESENTSVQEVPAQETTDEEMTDETGNTAEGETATEDEATDGYSPEIDPANFVEQIDNPYFPLTPGTTFVYEDEDEEGATIDVEIYVTDETREVMGVTTTVVRETEWEDGELVEDTYDWFAQDADGNVWYFGEESNEYEDGEVVSTAGSWEAGVDGAQPGIIMQADPQIGDVYRQEYYEGEAEDMAEVIGLDDTATVAYGSFDNVLVTREWTPLEPGIEENKYYAMDVGLLMEEKVEGGSETLELVDITTE
jgi:hypothetical protein